MHLVTKLSAIVIVVVTTLGVVMHDMHIDKATATALAVPIYAGATTAAEKEISSNPHVHVERASVGRFTSSLPKAQPPREDGRRYILNKKVLFSGGADAVTLWPSV